MRQIPIDCNEHFESSRCQGKQLAILDRGPPHLFGGLDVVADNSARKAPIDALIEQDSHGTDSTSFSFASSRKAITCARVTVGKPSRNSSMESPASRYSMSVCTGTRVPQKTGVPLITSGSRQMTDWLIRELYQKWRAGPTVRYAKVRATSAFTRYSKRYSEPRRATRLRPAPQDDGISSLKSVKRPRIAGINLLAAPVAQARRHDHERVIEIPVRIVRREQDAVETDRRHDVDEVRRVFRLLHRLGGDPEMIVQVFRGRPRQMQQA